MTYHMTYTSRICKYWEIVMSDASYGGTPTHPVEFSSEDESMYDPADGRLVTADCISDTGDAMLCFHGGRKQIVYHKQ